MACRFVKDQKGQPGDFNATFVRQTKHGAEAIGKATQSPWLYTTPWAMRPMLNYIWQKWVPT